MTSSTDRRLPTHLTYCRAVCAIDHRAGSGHARARPDHSRSAPPRITNAHLQLTLRAVELEDLERARLRVGEGAPVLEARGLAVHPDTVDLRAEGLAVGAELAVREDRHRAAGRVHPRARIGLARGVVPGEAAALERLVHERARVLGDEPESRAIETAGLAALRGRAHHLDLGVP